MVIAFNLDYLITGQPIKTPYGECSFIKIKDYPQFQNHLALFKMSKKEIIYNYSKKENNQYGELDELIAELKKMTLFEITGELENFKEAYESIFNYMFGKNILENISEDDFNEIRNLILKMCVLKEEKISSNPEIQRANERSQRVKQADSGNVELADIIDSVAIGANTPIHVINEGSMYQLYRLYYRIAQFKNYETTTLFATVSPEAGKNIESWSKSIDLFEEEKHYMSRESFFNSTKGFAQG
ncbi:hypothetical protein NSQ30_10920 [Bacillus sp. FSL R7-0651]|uniref:hypothetical protein n=1 Tax=Bacillus TaxID=1386 RepID=UPI001C24BEAB|nr:hypothetical protein [Bacillus pumilus]MBU8573769.1 hypothetical protein [Bacillus pumilus]